MYRFCVVFTILALSFTAVPVRGRRLQQSIVCSGLDAVCSADCYASGGSYYKYDCNSDTCGCSTNPVGACFPGNAMVETPTGPKKISQIALGDDVLTVSATGERQFNKVSAYTAASDCNFLSFLPKSFKFSKSTLN